MSVAFPTHAPTSFDMKLPDEIENYSVDFGARLPDDATISETLVTPTVYSGEDPAPEGIMIGDTGIVGSSITQQLRAGIAGVTYLLTFKATLSDGQVLEEQRLLPVKPFRDAS